MTAQEIRKFAITLVLVMFGLIAAFFIMSYFFAGSASTNTSQFISVMVGGSVLFPILVTVIVGFLIRSFLKKSGLTGLMNQALSTGKTSEATTQLRQTGTHATAKIISIADTYVTVQKNPIVRLELEVTPSNEPSFRTTVQATVSRVAIPRVGDQISVVFDPKDHTKVVTE